MSSALELANKITELLSTKFTTQDPVELKESRAHVEALCFNLLRTIQKPEEYTTILGESCHESAALFVVSELGIADLIAESPNGQSSLKELADKTNTHEAHLSVSLNCVMLHGYFTEVGGFGSEIFANTDLSNCLRSGRSGEGTLRCAIGLAADDAAKAASRLLDAADRKTTKIAGNIAFGTEGSYYEWTSSPGQEWRGQRMGKAMIEYDAICGEGVGEDIPWETFSSPIVDIGGGVGSLERQVFAVPKNKDLKFIIFDIQKTADHAARLFASEPKWIQDRISFVGGDFMKSSPAENKIPTGSSGVKTYIIRHVLHNWTDSQVVQILKNVRAAMFDSGNVEQNPKLVIIEMMLTENSSRFVRSTSVQLLVLTGGVSRTEAQLARLFKQAGFAIENVTNTRGTDSAITLVPM